MTRTGSSPERLDDRVEATLEDVLLDHERRREDQDVAVTAAATDEDALLAQRPLRLRRELGIRFLGAKLEPEEEAATADVADGGVPGQFAREAPEGVRPQPRGTLDEPVLTQDVDCRAAGRGVERVRKEGGRDRVRLPGRHQLGAAQERGERQAAADPLPNRQQVGHDSLVVGGPHPPTPPEAALNLVEDEQRAGAVAQLPQAAEEPFGRDDDAAVSLDRLNEDARRGLHSRRGVGERMLEEPEGHLARIAARCPGASVWIRIGDEVRIRSDTELLAVGALARVA